ncbi:MAG: response regulator [bacterium]|nr:response regulator [bacterium]
MHRFLIVDDNAIERTLYETIINYHFDSPRVDFAVNGLEALSKSNNNEYDVIIVDIEMPLMNGITFFQQLRKSSPQKAENVIFSSANIDNHRRTFFDHEDCLKINKPFSRNELLHMINNTIKKKQRLTTITGGSGVRNFLRIEANDDCVIKYLSSCGSIEGKIKAKTLNYSKAGLSLYYQVAPEITLKPGGKVKIFADQLAIFDKEAEVVWSRKYAEKTKLGLRWLQYPKGSI